MPTAIMLVPKAATPLAMAPKNEIKNEIFYDSFIEVRLLKNVWLSFHHHIECFQR